jgi:hypothetical protein
MAIRDRREARLGALTSEDRELKSHLNDAKRALERALSVCSKVKDVRPMANPTTPEEIRQAAEVQAQAGNARQNFAQITSLLGQLDQVGDFKSKLAQDMDLLPEDIRASMSREALKDRIRKSADKRKRATEDAVSSLLASLHSAGNR